jgi:hypothetical protein
MGLPYSVTPPLSFAGPSRQAPTFPISAWLRRVRRATDSGLRGLLGGWAGLDPSLSAVVDKARGTSSPSQSPTGRKARGSADG